MPAMGIGRINSRREALADFPISNHKSVSRGAKSVEISFFLFETRKATFFAKNVIEKCQI